MLGSSPLFFFFFEDMLLTSSPEAHVFLSRSNQPPPSLPSRTLPTHNRYVSVSNQYNNKEGGGIQWGMLSVLAVALALSGRRRGGERSEGDGVLVASPDAASFCCAVYTRLPLRALSRVLCLFFLIYLFLFLFLFLFLYLVLFYLFFFSFGFTLSLPLYFC